MTSQPVYLNLMWHMHQPYYKDLVAGKYVLPWVRLHGIKDYFDMVRILDDHPGAKAVFNMVPSLVQQIDDYVSNNAKDLALIISEKDPKDLSEEELVYLLKNFFMANWEVMIKPYKRYHALLLKRGRFASASDLSSVGRRFTTQEIIDLQVWFNLTWFGYDYRKNDPVVSELFRKGQGFTAQEKTELLKKQIELLGKIVPKCAEAAGRGQVELTTSPFYHPILPLVCDTHIAKESMPHANLPSVRFRRPEDADRQISDAVRFHEERFGSLPLGMWPSEGSVSEEALALAAKNGIKWTATDESVLASTLKKGLSAEELYSPYRLSKDGTEIDIVFRNHFLSDQIGFVYQRWRAKDAVLDFKKHLHNIRAALPDDGKKYLVSVILDGENAWEYYRDGGEEFLHSFYDGLSNDPNIKPVLVKDFLAENGAERRIDRLFPASWINNNFKVWIGHDEDNEAWDLLSRARTAIEGCDNPLAWQELYVAEGSDWCWWYGDDHSSENDETFDSLYRKHLSNIYELAGKEPPKILGKPIKQLRALRPTKEPVFFIEPVIDGMVTNYYEWLSAGCFDVESSKGAMHQIETVLKALYYGFSRTMLYFRFDCNIGLKEAECRDFTFLIHLHHPAEIKMELKCSESGVPALDLYALESEAWVHKKKLDDVGVGKIIEIGVPFSDIGAKPGDEVQFSASISKEGNELERWPRGGMLQFIVPTSSYEMEQWSV